MPSTAPHPGARGWRNLANGELWTSALSFVVGNRREIQARSARVLMPRWRGSARGHSCLLNQETRRYVQIRLDLSQDIDNRVGLHIFLPLTLACLLYGAGEWWGSVGMSWGDFIVSVHGIPETACPSILVAQRAKKGARLRSGCRQQPALSCVRYGHLRARDPSGHPGGQ